MVRELTFHMPPGTKLMLAATEPAHHNEDPVPQLRPDTPK